MKRSTSIFLVFTFLAYFAGFYIYFVLRLNQIHQEMRSQLRYLPAEQLQIIKLSFSAYQKARVEDDEIEVDGEMYDIARVDQSQDSVVVYCIHDEAEDNLLSFLDTVLKNASQDKKPIPSGLFTLLEMDALPKVVHAICKDGVKQKSFTAYQRNVDDFIPILNTPPPRNV